MKKTLFAVLLMVVTHLSTFGATSLGLVYPLGGEILPNNGKHIITWTNSSNLAVQLYFDWYDTNGTLLVGDNILYSATLSEGTNTFVLNRPSRYPSEHQYKVRITGNTNEITSTSDFVRVTSPILFTGVVTNQNPWLPGQTRNITVSWSGLETNDTYDLVLESPVLGKEGYGFLITNSVGGSTSGTQTLSLPYPLNPVNAYPPASYNLTDGMHIFTVYNKRCDVVTNFGSIDVVTTGLRIHLTSSGTSYILKGESNSCALVFIDATLATNSVLVTNVAAVFTSYSTNEWSLKFSVKDGSQTISANTLSFNPSTNEQYHTRVDFPMNLTVSAGQVKELQIFCEVHPTSGLGTFIWTTEEISSFVQGDIDGNYVGGASIVKAVFPSAGSYIDVIEVIQPKFFMTSMQSNSISFSVLCKSLTYYILQSSTNLTSWTNVLTTNSVTDNLFLSIPIEGGNKFFRLKEQ